MPNFNVSPEDALLFFAVALLAIYLVLFVRLNLRHPNDATLLRSDRTGKRHNMWFAPVVIAAVVAPMPYKAVAVVVAIPALVGLSWAQHKRLARLGATPGYLRQMSAVSAVGVAALVSFAATYFVAAGG